MGRTKLFFFSLAAGQVFLACNVIYSLVSVPLALGYLSVQEFGLWAVVMQVASFLLLLDAGFSSATGRLLVDVKDNRPNLQYGRLVLATFTILLIATACVIALGIALSAKFLSWMRMPDGLLDTATSLLVGQIIISACTIPSRIVGGCLTAHGRIDLLNSIFTVSVLGSLAAMWAALHLGVGVYSLLWASGFSAICTTVVSLVAAWICGHLPTRQELSYPRASDFVAVALFGQNIFLNQLGTMVLTLSQSVLLGRFASLEIVGTWSVGSKMFALIQQAADKLSQSAGPIYSEMWVRNEVKRFNLRMANLKNISVLAASVGAAILVAFNSDFISLWTRGKIHWNPHYNLILAALFVVRVINTTDSLPILASKQFGFYRFIPLLEASCFVVGAVLLIPSQGILGLLVAWLVAALLVTTPYLLWREHVRISSARGIASYSLGCVAAGCLPPVAAVFSSNWLGEQISVWTRMSAAGAAIAFASVPLAWLTWHAVKQSHRI